MISIPYGRILVLLLALAIGLGLYLFRPGDRLDYRIYSYPFWPPTSPERPQEVRHLPTPSPLKALYMTARVGANPRWREKLTSFIEAQEFNAVVIDVRDISGRTFFELYDADGQLFEGVTNRYGDVRALVGELNRRGIYTIGRICLFRDRVLAERHPEWTVRSRRDGSVWRDYAGDAWLDPGVIAVWERAAETALAAHRAGFDEINFDYIRYPTDGDRADALYPHSGTREKRDVMRGGFALLDRRLRANGIVTSIDVFGMVMLAEVDQDIGQHLDDLPAFFDFICPMTYPSHYPDGYLDFVEPLERCYGTVRHSLDEGVRRLEAQGANPAILRPWLQDFDYPHRYDAPMVQAQLQATYDAGLNSWMMWNSRSTFTRNAYTPAHH